MINDTTMTTGQSQPRAPFNPNEHLIKIKNRNVEADYLPVAWRLVWFRSECPNGTIETEIIHLDPDKETEEETYVWNSETRRSEKVIKTARGLAIVRATVRDGKGGIATGTKMEKAASFGDWLEKSETGAIGRALAALGYGTQFTGDEFDERHRIVDAPVDRGASIAAVENNHTQKATPEAIAKPAVVANERTQAASANNKPQQRSAEPDPNGPVADPQWSALRKLCQELGKQVGKPTTYGAAKVLIAQLSKERREGRPKAG